MSSRSPLLERDLDGVIAQLRSPLRPLGELRRVDVKRFLAQVNCLSQQLPEGQYALNLCSNRYLFLLAFCAVIIRRQTNLLPPNKNIATQKLLAERYAATYIIHDSAAIAAGDTLPLAENLPAFDVAAQSLDVSEDRAVPSVELDHLGAISFTSGSTGESAPNIKTWRTLRDSSRINVRFMLPAQARGSLLATVPAQHMWGLETSVLNSLFANVCVSDARPLFPKDIQELLLSLPAPRYLVSTPVHLRALVASGLEFPGAARILCATAPLSGELAQHVERLFQGELCEVYGCSEAGSMAFRRTAQEALWTLFEGFTLRPTDTHSHVEVHASHLPAVVPLQDLVDFQPGKGFALCGRRGDMVDIAGKRGSLQEMNQTLLALPGVRDGVVFLPSQDTRRIPRLVALVVADDDFDKGRVALEFRRKLDEAFVPRPIYRVDALPREESGKLSKQRLEDFWRSLRSPAKA